MTQTTGISEQIAPITEATAGLGPCIHRFFDTSPVSPSGRFLAVTELPYDDREPEPSAVARVCVVDLQTKETVMRVPTGAWDTQLGAQVQWGANDHELYFNDRRRVDSPAFGVKMDPFSGQRADLEGTVYMVSPTGDFLISPNLANMSQVQRGYGVLMDPERIPLNHGFNARDGLWGTHVASGRSRLLISFADLADALPELPRACKGEGGLYGFHAKWSPTGDRLMFVVRWAGESGARRWIIVADKDGTNPQLALDWEAWRLGGHHPDWAPDGRSITMNLRLAEKEPIRFVRFEADGGNRRVLAPRLLGSGHPTLHPACNFLLTDVYAHEPLAYPDGSTPLRWIDLESQSEQVLARVHNTPPFTGRDRIWRIDLHPAWNRSFDQVAFNFWNGSKRSVAILDMRSLLPAFSG